MGWVQSRLLSPSCLPLRAHLHRDRDVWVRGRNKPLSGPKIVGKTEQKKKALNFESWLTSTNFLLHQLHAWTIILINVCFFSVQTDAFMTVYVWCCGSVTGIFLFIMRSGFILFKASRREPKRLDNMEAECLFHGKTFPLQSTAWGSYLFPSSSN